MPIITDWRKFSDRSSTSTAADYSTTASTTSIGANTSSGSLTIDTTTPGTFTSVPSGWHGQMQQQVAVTQVWPSESNNERFFKLMGLMRDSVDEAVENPTKLRKSILMMLKSAGLSYGPRKIPMETFVRLPHAIEYDDKHITAELWKAKDLSRTFPLETHYYRAAFLAFVWHSLPRVSIERDNDLGGYVVSVPKKLVDLWEEIGFDFKEKLNG